MKELFNVNALLRVGQKFFEMRESSKKSVRLYFCPREQRGSEDAKRNIENRKTRHE